MDQTAKPEFDYAPHGPQPYEVCHKNAAVALDTMTSQRGDKIGWTFDDTHVSFSEMQARSVEVARALLAVGVERGDKVACLIPNVPEFAYLLFGCARIGAIIIPINTRSRLFELGHALRHSGAKLLLTADKLLSQDFVALVQDLVGVGSFGADGTVNSPEFGSLKMVIAMPQSGDALFLPYQRFIARGEGVPLDRIMAIQATVGAMDPLLVQYTSGTTARPKGALVSHEYVLNYGASHIARLGVGLDEAWLNTQPIYHAGGSCAAVPVPVVLGNRVVMAAVYEPRRMLELIEREKCVSRTGFVAMYLMEMEHPDFERFDLSSLRSGWCNGPVEVLQRVRERMGISQLVQIYGSTEANGTVGQVGEPTEKQIRSCGKPIEEMEIAIIDLATGASVPPGTVGEIRMRGWCTMIEYLNQPVETAAVKAADGWVASGDYGMLDEQGFLYFKGRLKNMIRVGGENVSAEEVEAILIRHPKVQMVAAIPQLHPRLEEVVKVIIELVPGAQASEQEIIAYCKPQMANFRVPRSVAFVSEWPLTESGKIQRHVLREQFAAEAMAAEATPP